MRKTSVARGLAVLLLIALLCGSCVSGGAENFRVFTQSFEGAGIEYLGDRYYEKDTIQVKVDDNGKIVECTVKQEKHDLAPIVYIDTEGIFVYYQCDDYVLVQSDWKLKSGAGLSFIPVLGDLIKEISHTWKSYTWYYKMTNEGTLRASTKKLEPDSVATPTPEPGGDFGGGGGGGRFPTEPPSIVTPSTLKIKDVLYPSEFKIDRVNGFYVTSGVVESNNLITYVSINLTDAQGVPVKGHPRSYTPNSRSFSIAAKDADIKFTAIQTPGDYVFTIFAQDASGVTKTLSMPVHATKDGSTVKALGNSADAPAPTPIPAPQRLPGDVNRDEKVNTADVLLLLKYVSGWGVSIAEENADVTGDEKINTADVLQLLKYVSGWDVTLR